MLILLIGWFLTAIVTSLLAHKMGRSTLGWFLLSLLIGPFAVVILPLVGVKRRPAATLTAQIDELDRLLKRKKITQAEYDSRRASLLA